jgi:hypothetical protein
MAKVESNSKPPSLPVSSAKAYGGRDVAVMTSSLALKRYSVEAMNREGETRSPSALAKKMRRSSFPSATHHGGQALGTRNPSTI